jgi:hypothetical protein
MEDAAPKSLQGPTLFAPPKYATMGPKEAVIDLLSGLDHPIDTSAIEIELQKGGVKSNSADFAGVVKSTLASLKKAGKVERLEEGWRLTLVPHHHESPSSWSSNEHPQPLPQ